MRAVRVLPRGGQGLSGSRDDPGTVYCVPWGHSKLSPMVQKTPRVSARGHVRSAFSRVLSHQLQPLVAPQVSHFRQVPLRTMVKLEHSEQASPV